MLAVASVAWVVMVVMVALVVLVEVTTLPSWLIMRAMFLALVVDMEQVLACMATTRPLLWVQEVLLVAWVVMVVTVVTTPPLLLGQEAPLVALVVALVVAMVAVTTAPFLLAVVAVVMGLTLPPLFWEVEVECMVVGTIPPFTCEHPQWIVQSNGLFVLAKVHFLAYQLWV